MDIQGRSSPLALPVINVIIQIPGSGISSATPSLGGKMKMCGVGG